MGFMGVEIGLSSAFRDKLSVFSAKGRKTLCGHHYPYNLHSAEDHEWFFGVAQVCPNSPDITERSLYVIGR